MNDALNPFSAARIIARGLTENHGPGDAAKALRAMSDELFDVAFTLWCSADTPTNDETSASIIESAWLDRFAEALWDQADKLEIPTQTQET